MLAGENSLTYSFLKEFIGLGARILFLGKRCYLTQIWKVLTTVPSQSPHRPEVASRHSCVRSALTSSEMWSQCSISLCRSGCLLMSARVSGSLCSPSMKYTSSCSRTSEVTWRTMRCNSAVDVRIPISELNKTFSHQIWSGFLPPKPSLVQILFCCVL